MDHGINVQTVTMEHGINVQYVTMDGTTTNINAMKLFGFKFGNTSYTIDGSFSFEVFDYKLYFIMGPCHCMLKLARNALSDVGVVVNGNNREIKWKHIQNLPELQEEEGLTFGNKLSKSNIFLS